jgi:hypothetical protein
METDILEATLTRTSRKRKEKEGKLLKRAGPEGTLHKSWRDWPEGFPDLKKETSL